MHTVLEERLIPKVTLAPHTLSPKFGSGKASFTAKNENCYLVT